MAMTRRTGLMAAVTFLCLSWSSHHHWDEFFYLYSSAFHSPRELMGFDTLSNMFPAGYLSGKIGHVALLHALVGLTGRGRTALLVLQAFYALLLLATVAAASGLYGELVDERLRRRSTLVLLFLPVTLYLSYKLLSEVPSFLCTTLASWAFVRAFRVGSRTDAILLLSASTAALAGGMLCRVSAPLGFVGLAIGLLAAGDRRFPRSRVLLLGMPVMAGAIALHAACLAWLGGSELRLLGLAEAVAVGAKGFERVYGAGMFFQTFALVLPFAFRRPWPPAVRMASVWLAATVLPNLTGHEPRYYAPALLPLAIVVALGIEGLTQRVSPRSGPRAWAATLAGLVLVNRLTLFPLMPYEVAQQDLERVGTALGPSAASGTVLLPWATDYCFLRFAFPGLPVRLAMSALPQGRYRSLGRSGPIALADQVWAERARYVGGLATLERAQPPWYYVGWSYNPVMLRIRSILSSAGLDILGDPRRMGWHDHLAESWIWKDPRLAKVRIGRLGQYEIYGVTPAGAVTGLP